MRVIKFGIQSLAKPITILLNKIINTGKFPQEFKTALVTAAHKKGDKNKEENYRPLSVLPCVSKVAEYAIKKQLYEYLESKLGPFHVMHVTFCTQFFKVFPMLSEK